MKLGDCLWEGEMLGIEERSEDSGRHTRKVYRARKKKKS